MRAPSSRATAVCVFDLALGVSRNLVFCADYRFGTRFLAKKNTTRWHVFTSVMAISKQHTKTRPGSGRRQVSMIEFEHTNIQVDHKTTLACPFQSLACTSQDRLTVSSGPYLNGCAAAWLGCRSRSNDRRIRYSTRLGANPYCNLDS
jgi:hypothetical protein